IETLLRAVDRHELAEPGPIDNTFAPSWGFGDKASTGNCHLRRKLYLSRGVAGNRESKAVAYLGPMKLQVLALCDAIREPHHNLGTIRFVLAVHSAIST